MNTKIAIFSDIHGNLQALQAILKDIKAKQIDEVIYLGDIISIGPNPKECLDLIIKSKIMFILGNHDLYFLNKKYFKEDIDDNEKEHQKWVDSKLSAKYKTYFNSCPLQIVKLLGKTKVSFQHFLFTSNKIYPFESLNIVKNGEINSKLDGLYDITFIGHEHNTFEIKKSKKELICVGSSGCTKGDNTFYTILNYKNNDITIEKINLKYDRKKLENTLKNSPYPCSDFISKIFFGIQNS